MDDLIDRSMAIDALGERPAVWVGSDYELGARNQFDADVLALETVPSAEPLTDNEKRIFLAAMGREEKVCKEIDKDYVREAYEDSLMWVCKEIKRKVKAALWGEIATER